jgi:hypothetical protein
VDNLWTEDDSYAKRKTKDLSPGDIVVWGERHDRRMVVADVRPARLRRCTVTLVDRDTDQVGVLENISRSLVWWVLR